MKEVVSSQHGIALVILFILGNSPLFSLAGQAGSDLWLAFLVAIALAFPLILVYTRFRILLYGQTLWEGLAAIIGQWPMRILALYYGFYAWRLCSWIVDHVTAFLVAVPYENTPETVFSFGFTILAWWAVKEGLEVLARLSAVLLKIVGLVVFTTFILTLTEANLENFLPFFYHGFTPIARGALQLLNFPFLEIVLFLWAFDSFVSKKSPAQIFIPGFLVAAFLLMLFSSTSLAVVGVDKYVGSYFPGHVAVSRINIARFLSRLEIAAGIVAGIGSFIKLALCLLVASKGFARGLGFKDYRFLVTPLALGVIPGSQWFNKSAMEIHKKATAVWSTYNFVIQVGIPILLWIIAEIKLGKKSRGAE
ncbi:MAG: endospore germination permease [Firmicutes bacterium]|nr:endospore germination permease [Bacillota bacterium]